MLELIVQVGGITLMVLIGVLLVVGSCLVLSFILAVVTHDEQTWLKYGHRRDILGSALVVYFANLPRSGQYKKVLIHGLALVAIGGSLLRLIWMQAN